VFKKRPRAEADVPDEFSTNQTPSKLEPDYWRRRLFKNSFTYKGKSRKVNGWSVKIQLFGRRKTFSLSASSPALAASEACHIYQTISAQGWDAIGNRPGKAGLRLLPGKPAGIRPPAAFNNAHWESRLIHRKHPETTHGHNGRQLAARIEHAGVSRYFPLGASDEAKAAAEALQIHQTVVVQGWAVANQKFARELTLALRWLDNPLAWTYTTVHTWKNGDAFPSFIEPDAKAGTRRAAVIEPDAGIRYALAACANSQENFRCCGAFNSVAEASRELPRRGVDLVLINYALPDRAGAVALEELQRTQPGLVGLLYSEFEDSDELFKATPGGSAGYLLKRTPAHRIFEPIVETTGPLTRELVAAKIREYFQQLVAAMPSGASALTTAKLTPREHEILALLAKGHLAKEIADTLGISIWTVHGHVKSIFEKLNVHTRTEAVVKFLQK